MLERNCRCVILVQCSRGKKTEREIEVVEVCDVRVSKEAMITIKQLLLEFKVSWSKIKFMELDASSILILSFLQTYTSRQLFFSSLQCSPVGG